MLWYTKKQHKTILLVGNLEKRMYWQALDKTHQPDAHASKGASACSGAMKSGGLMPVLQSNIFSGVMSWAKFTQSRETKLINKCPLSDRPLAQGCSKAII